MKVNKILLTVSLLSLMLSLSSSKKTINASVAIFPPIEATRINSDYGPRNNPDYDFHYGIDLGTNSQRILIRSIEGGEIYLSRGSYATITIGRWQYLHSSVGSYSCSPYSSVNRTYMRFKYVDENGELQNMNESSDCVVFFRDTNTIEKILCNPSDFRLVYVAPDGQRIYPRSRVNPHEEFALVGDTGTPNSIHLHLQIKENNVIKNPFMEYPHRTENYSIQIDEPTNNEKISHDKAGTERVKFTVNSQKSLDFEKAEIYLFSAVKNEPTNKDLINCDSQNNKGVISYAGKEGNNRPAGIINASPKSMCVKHDESGRGTWTRTGINPLGVGLDEFYFAHLNTKIDKDGNDCTDLRRAKYRDGEYYLFVKAYSILDKSYTEKQKIILDNWHPKIQSITDNSSKDKIIKSGEKLQIKIEFTEQMKTSETPVVSVWDSKNSSWVSFTLQSSSWQNSWDGMIKNTTFVTTLIMPDFGETDSKNTKDLKLKVTKASGLGDNDIIQEEDSEKTVEGEPLKLNADLYIPKAKNGSVMPSTVYDEEPQTIYALLEGEDYESGLSSAEFVVEGVGTFPASMYSGDAGTTRGLRCSFTSPQIVGKYKVWLVTLKDNAENKTKKQLIGTLVVKDKPDKPGNPDESIDTFDSSITNNQAQCFGQVKTAILKAGYCQEMKDLLISFGEASDLIPPEQFGPGLVNQYTTLIVPSAALSTLQNISNLRDKFTAYAEAGGNLLIMTQPMDTCYKLLPDKIESVGYFQDKACYYATAGIRKYNFAMAGQNDETVDGTADGVITSWPNGAEVWLYRLKNNFPALLMYPCGKGRVIVSNYYSDYAHGHSQLNQDERDLLRDLLAWGRDFSDNIPEVKPGESTLVNVSVSYLKPVGVTTEAAVSQIRFILRDPDRKKIADVEIPAELVVGEKKSLSFDFKGQSKLGIWWVNYEILDAQGNVVQTELEGERVAVSKHLTGQNISNVAVTVNPVVTNALEGTKIPFQIIARNNGDNSRSIRYKVFAVLGSSSGRVTKEEEVGNGSITINPHDETNLTSEQQAFKAYATASLQSWAKNWWRFAFYDENGAEIVNELRSISVYKPAVQVKTQLRNLSDAKAVIFKPGDKVGLDLMLVNYVPVGYPIQWEIKVRANQQNGRIIYQESGEGQLNPVVNPFISFSVPDDCSPDTYQVDVVVKNNNMIVPLIQSGESVSTRQLIIDNFRVTSKGINFDLHNKGNQFANYVIISRLNGSNGYFYEDSHFGVINAQSDETKLVACDINNIQEGGSLNCYITDPTTGSETGFSYGFRAINCLKVKMTSCQQDLTTGKINCNLSLSNTGLMVKNAKLKVISEGINYSEVFALPVINVEETINMPLTLNLPEGLKPDTYPIKFILMYESGLEITSLNITANISIDNLKATNEAFEFNLRNDSMLNADYQVVSQFYNDNHLIKEETESGIVGGSDSKQISYPVNYNPFKSTEMKCTLISPSMGKEKKYSLVVEPYALNLTFDPLQQVVHVNQIHYNGSIKNCGPKVANLKLQISIKALNIIEEIAVPDCENQAEFHFDKTIDIPENTPPGVYPVEFILVSQNGYKQIVGKDMISVALPQLSVEANAADRSKPNDSYSLTITNTGNATTDIAYEVTLYDGNSVKVAIQNGKAQLRVNEKVVPTWNLPATLCTGNYLLTWSIKTSPLERSIQGAHGFSVDGCRINLNVMPELPVYDVNQLVKANSEINNPSAYPMNGTLNLSISKLTPVSNGLGEWNCYGGDSSGCSYSKMAGGIDQPFVTWNGCRYSYAYNLYPLVGNIIGDENNEVVHICGAYLDVLDGRIGQVIKECVLPNIFPSMQQKVTAASLYDVDGDGYQEIFLCVDDKYVAALNGNMETLWVKSFDGAVLDGPSMAIGVFGSDERPLLFLNSYVLDARTGEVVKTGIPSGALSDINGDGKKELIAKDSIYNENFETITSRTGSGSPKRIPMISDINHDSLKELILFDENGLYVYNNQYQLLWSQPIQSLSSVAVGDLDGDGVQEVVGVQSDIDWQDALFYNEYDFSLVCYNADGTERFKKSLQIVHSDELFYYDYFVQRSVEIATVAIADINGDQKNEIVMGSLLNGIQAFDITGNVVMDMGAQLNIVTPLAMGDVDGDAQAEIIAGGAYDDGYLCIDNSKGLKEPTIYQPYDEIDYAPEINSNDYCLVQTNGDLWAAGTNYVSYFKVSTQETGIIPIKTRHQYGEYLTLRINGNLIEVWSKGTNTILGTIDTVTDTFTEKQEKHEDFYLYDPLLTYGDFYYSYTMNSGALEIIKTNIQTNQQQSLGSVAGDYSSAEISLILAMDESTIFMKLNTGYAILSLKDMLIRSLTTVLPEGAKVKRLDNSALMYAVDNGDGVHKVDIVQDKDELAIPLSLVTNYLAYSYDNGPISYGFMPRDNDKIYIAVDGYASLLQYTLSTNTLITAASMKTYQPFNSNMCRIGQKLYYTYEEVNRLYEYNVDTKETKSYPFPQADRKFKVGRVYPSPGNLLSITGNYINENALTVLDFDPANSTWNISGPYYMPTGIQLQDSCYGETEDTIYMVYTLNNTYHIGMYQRSTGSIKDLDSSEQLENLAYDQSTKTLFYLKNGGICYFDTLNQTFGQLITGLPYGEFQIIGAKNNELYINWCPTTSAGRFVTYQMLKYSLADHKLSKLYMFSMNFIGKQLGVGEFQTLNFGSQAFNSDTDYLEYCLLDSAFEFDLQPIDLSSQVQPFQAGMGTTFRKVTEKDLPVKSDPNTLLNLKTELIGLAEPGTYMLQGVITNESGQTVAQDKTIFYVSDGILNLQLNTDKEYYKPGEAVTIVEKVRNISGKTLNGLRLVLACINKDKRNVLQDEPLDLAVGQSFELDAETSSMVEGESVLEALIYQGNQVIAQCQGQVQIIDPTLKVEILAPDMVGSQPFDVQVNLTNPNPYAVTFDLNASILNLNRQITLQPNGKIAIHNQVKISADTELKLSVSGDVEGSYSKKIEYAEAIQIVIPSRIAQNEGVSYQFANTGKIAVDTDVVFRLFQGTQLVVDQSLHLMLGIGESLESIWPVGLSTGEYRLVVDVSGHQEERLITCLPAYAAEFTADSQIKDDQLELSFNIKNHGLNPIQGTVSFTSEFQNGEVPVKITPGGEGKYQAVLQNLPLQAGNYQIVVSLNNGNQTLATQVLAFVREEAIQPVADIILGSVPVNITGGVGQEMPVSVTVRNDGAKSGDGIVELLLDGLYADSQVVNLEPGTEKVVTFNATLPDEMETGTYQGKISINGKATAFSYQINGYQLNATATLDKPSYIKDETAVLSLHVQNKGGQSNVPLTVRVKHGNFDETREIVLGSAMDLTYNIPAEDFDQKIFYGFYHTGTGKSLLLDVANLRESIPELTVSLDKERYKAGESVSVTVDATQEDWLAIAGPGGFHQFEKVNFSKTYQIPLPGTLNTGTYSIWVAFAGKTMEYKIDVLGHDIRFVSGELNDTNLITEEPFKLHSLITSTEDLKTNAVLELVKPDKTVTKIAVNEVNLVKGENAINFSGQISSEQTGTHWLRVRIEADGVTLGMNDYAVQLGKEELLNIRTAQNDYPNGSESVKGEIELYGKGSGSVMLQIDGKPVDSLSVVLNGQTMVPFDLSSAVITPGHHKISATYQGTGKTGTVSWEFDYGSQLPDLQVSQFSVGKERTELGDLPITVEIKKTNTLPAKNINVQVKLDSTVIEEYVIDQLVEPDAINEHTFNWKSGSFAGTGTLSVTINNNGNVLEYDTTNNTASQSIMIPATPSFSGLSETMNNPHPSINGTTTPEALVLLYNDKEILDFAYADTGGQFTLNQISLNEGENHLCLKARSKEGWSSGWSEISYVFVDSIVPQIIISNIIDGQFFNSEVTPDIFFSEENLQVKRCMIDGEPWTIGTKIHSEGLHQMSIYVQDRANNEASLNLSFNIDQTPPQITLNGLPENGGSVDQSVTPIVQISDQNIADTSITLNGMTYNGEPITEPGYYEFAVIAYDKAGNNSESYVSFTIEQTDTTPPVTQADYPSGWMNTNVTVNLTATDTESGVKETQYRVDGGDWSVGTNIIISIPGIHTIEFFSVDNTGNAESPQTITIKIDKASPKSHTAIAGEQWSNGAYKSKATVTLTAADETDGSGVSKIYYRLGSTGEYTLYSNSIILDKAGINELYVYAEDVAGNQEAEQRYEIRIIPIYSPNYSLLCKGLTIYGTLNVDRIFVNGTVNIYGQCQLNYLGTTASSILKTGPSAIGSLNLRQPYALIPTPDWNGLQKVTTLRRETQIPQDVTLANVRFENSLMIGATTKLSGIIVVKGDLTINGNVTLDNVGIYCSGKVTFSGSVNGTGMIYAGQGVVGYSNLAISGAVISNGPVQVSGSLGNKGVKLQQYLNWLMVTESK